MKNLLSLDVAELKMHFHYNEVTGVFTRRTKSANNTYNVGDVAGFTDSYGYVIIAIGGVEYKAHRLAFLYMKGYMPKLVDHKDRVKSNNAWANLRETTHSLNMYNCGLRSHNTSGVKGVTYNKRDSTWMARIGVNGKSISLGTYSSKQLAIQARRDAELRYYGF